jgi:transcriptional regulator with XRE-family HTH domain
MSQDDHYINGELLRLGREARGWVIGDMATRACMSVKQIRQLEEGGTSAFYSPAVKMTSAKKLAGILELSPEQVFFRPKSVEVGSASSDDAVSELVPSEDQAVISEDLAHAHAQAETAMDTPEVAEALVSAPVVDEPKAKTSMWAIGALFVAAIAVAAYMHKPEEPVTEPPPPLQVVPAEADAAASAADAVASSASAPSEMPAAPAASTPVAPASSATPVVAAPPAAPKPAASAASKPL